VQIYFHIDYFRVRKPFTGLALRLRKKTKCETRTQGTGLVTDVAKRQHEGCLGKSSYRITTFPESTNVAHSRSEEACCTEATSMWCALVRVIRLRHGNSRKLFKERDNRVLIA